jgi:hypothetical protein
MTRTRSFWRGFVHAIALQGWIVAFPFYALRGRVLRWKQDRPVLRRQGAGEKQ